MKTHATVRRLMTGRETLALVDWRRGFRNGGNYLELHREGKTIEMGDCNCYRGCDVSRVRLSELRRQVAEWLDCVVDSDDREAVIREAMQGFDALIATA